MDRGFEVYKKKAMMMYHGMVLSVSLLSEEGVSSQKKRSVQRKKMVLGFYRMIRMVVMEEMMLRTTLLWDRGPVDTRAFSLTHGR